ncbi:DUF4880 domain-containing protein, partial [Achromobacter xylosoxidans]|uniref:DUF4880 domain-containing protein n=1 Tax=Alcaligenes xylosoxydans xylosoxydans TaxID=85698 RepID=UPI001E3E264B
MSAAAPSFQVLQQAAEWYAALGAPSVDAAERQRWRQWHDADPATSRPGARSRPSAASSSTCRV